MRRLYERKIHYGLSLTRFACFLGERGFRLYSGKRSEWTLPVDYSVRNSGPYKGHVDEAALIEGRGIKVRITKCDLKMPLRNIF